MEIETIKIAALTIHAHHLQILYCADEFQFSTQVFYHDVSFPALASNYSQSVIDCIAAHIALFEGMKLCSLFPKNYDVSTIAEHLSSASIDLFYQVYAGVFAQHWYENQVTDYGGPETIFPGKELGESHPTEILGDRQTILTGCGGGKDSIVAMKILQEADISFASMQYAHSIYGKAEAQHDLIADVLDCATPIRKHKISIYDNFVEHPFLELYFPQIAKITIPETPVSVFESLFLALQWEYHDLNLSHEKSANTGNFFWPEINREVNHQWGKSFAAETLLNQFIQNNLLANFTYFSLLQPIYDVRIFKNLARYPEVLDKIHSCNIQKPWCKKCPKCAYVWLGLMSVFPPKLVDSIFEKNLFDDPDLLLTFKQMLGLAQHTPFECIGEVDESRLNMYKCWEKGLSGKALDLFQETFLQDSSIDWFAIEQKYDRVYETEHNIPDFVLSRIKPYL